MSSLPWVNHQKKSQISNPEKYVQSGIQYNYENLILSEKKQEK